MQLLFWLWLIPAAWTWQHFGIRSERAVLTAGNQQTVCMVNQTVNLPAPPANTRVQTVVFELELTFDEREWTELQNNRKLPIMFKWFRFSGARLFITGVAQDQNAARAINVHRNAGGTVIHRARSVNERITSGTWVVAPVYADNTPLLINGRELTYQFRVP